MKIDNSKEYIICSAIWYPTLDTDIHNPKNIKTGMVVCGRRHHNVISVMAKLGVRTATANHTQGFMTSHNRFLDREESAKLAIEIKQIERTPDQEEIPTLVSEELY